MFNIYFSRIYKILVKFRAKQEVYDLEKVIF